MSLVPYHTLLFWNAGNMWDHLLQFTREMASTGADFGTRGPRLMVLLQKVEVIQPLRDQTSLEKVGHCGWAFKFYSLVHFLFTICFLGMDAQWPAALCPCQPIFPTVLVTFPHGYSKIHAKCNSLKETLFWLGVFHHFGEVTAEGI